MVCKKCGSEIGQNSKFCSQCGQNNELNNQGNDMLIREELNKYKKHTQLLCLECGYEGLIAR